MNAASRKPQAASRKPQAARHERQAGQRPPASSLAASPPERRPQRRFSLRPVLARFAAAFFRFAVIPGAAPRPGPVRSAAGRRRQYPLALPRAVMIPASHAHARLLVLLAASFVVAALTADPAQAQLVDPSLPPLADLSIVAGYGSNSWTLTVENNAVGAHPGRTVHSVTVRAVVEHPTDADETTILTIRDLPAEGRRVISIPWPSFVLDPAPERFPLRMTAEIIETVPDDPPGYQLNNATDHWIMVGEHHSAGSKRAFSRYTNGDTSVRIVSISDRLPQAGGATTFTVIADNSGDSVPAGSPTRVDHTQLDVQVRISLSPGLTFAAAQQPPVKRQPAGEPDNPKQTRFDKDTGIWDIGDFGVRDRLPAFPVAVNLTTDSLADLPLQERCLTVEVIRAVPWFEFVPSKRLNDTFTACLGGPPEAALVQGEVSLFHHLDCVGVTSPPCTTANALELVVERDGKYLQPEDVVVYIQEPRGRYFRRWRTGKTKYHDSSVSEPLGVEATYSYVPSSMGWSSYTLAISDVLPKQRPGKLTIWGGNQGSYEFLDADTKTSDGPYSPSDSEADAPYPVYVEFSALGTHQVQITTSATKAGTAYTDTATYTFHVGPVADLKMRDGGASPEVGGSQRAYTVMAVNNGPYPVTPDVEVMLTGVPQGAQASPSEGRYVETTCMNGLCAGDWIIGELGTPDVRRSSGLPERPTLTLITDAANPGPVTAVIESMGEYCVLTSVQRHDECGGNLPDGYTELVSPYYDYNDDNNTVTVQARAGTASEAGAAGAPRSLDLQQYGAIAILWWDWMDLVNGFPVAYFQVERNGIMVAVDLMQNMYVDLQGNVNQSYRVRAVNEFGVPGPWSSPAGGAAQGLTAPDGLSATPVEGGRRIDLRWSAPPAVSDAHYRIDHTDNGAGPWSVLATVHDGTAYVHDGLAPQTTHYYRVAAVQSDVMSAWVYVQATTGSETEDVGPLVLTVPSEPRNLRFSSVERTSVTLVWEPPADDGGRPVTGYEYWVIGPCDTGNYCDVVPPTRVSGTSRAISGLTREGHYDFQVRALNEVGPGAWSQGIVKTVNAPPPDSAPGGGRVVFSPSRVTVPEGGSATYRVKLTSSPDQPLWVALVWDGDYDMGTELPGEQFKTLLPSGYDVSGLIGKHCPNAHGVYDWATKAFAWNVGVPITVTALEDDDRENGRLFIEHDIFTVPAACLGNPAGYEPDPVYDGLYGIPLEVTERDND